MSGIRNVATFGITSWVVLAGAAFAGAQNCPPLSSTLKQSATSYVQGRYDNSGAENLHITDISSLGKSCYHKMTWQTFSGGRKITLYLTPDGRYLTTVLMDLSEEQPAASLKAEQIPMNTLLVGSPPSRGASNAPVTLVEFVDFQCPDCGRLAQMIAELPAKEASDVRLVLRHRPLSFHDWARKAAMMSICVEAQDEGAFWKLPGFLFSHQAQLTATNLEPQLLQFAKEDLHLNSEAITACMDRRGYENALEIDDHLAVQFGIHETPTVFVNGRRYAGFRSSDDLKRAINDALIEARRGRISSQIPAKR